MQRVLSLIGISVVCLSACTSLRQVMRSELKLAGDASEAKDGLTMQVNVEDLQSMQRDARLFKTVQTVQQTSAGGMQGQVGWALLDPPVFVVRVTNSTGHVVKLSGVVIKLVDSAGNLYDPVGKDTLSAKTADGLARFAQTGTSVTDAGAAAINSAIRSLKLLDQNTELLPDMTETYFLAFDLPVEPTEAAVNAWLAQQTALRLKIFEVPTAMNDAGAVTKRVAFEFPLRVTSYQDTYEDSLLGGSKLVSSNEIGK